MFGDGEEWATRRPHLPVCAMRLEAVVNSLPQNASMTGSQVHDWFIGAFGMLVALTVVLAVLWWAATTPPSETDGPSTGVPPVRPGDSSAPPPADLTDEELWLADMDLEATTLVLPDSTLTDVRAAGQGVRSGPTELAAERLTVAATVPFSDIATELGGDTQVRAAQDGQATVVRTVEVLGRQLTAVATGTVELENGRLVVQPQSIDLGGPDILSRATASAVRRLVTIEHAIEGLPEGLVLTEVDVHDTGFRVHLEGQDAVLVQAGSS